MKKYFILFTFGLIAFGNVSPAFCDYDTYQDSDGITYTKDGDNIYSNDGTNYYKSGNTYSGSDGHSYEVTGSTVYEDGEDVGFVSNGQIFYH